MNVESVMVYGVTGYTGALVSRALAEAGVHHVVAGRDVARVSAHARVVGLPSRAFALGDDAAIDAALRTCRVLLNCAGPFSLTAPPLAEGCLRGGTHYLDLAGEAPEHLVLSERHHDAVAAGVLLVPGVGFGVALTDAAAALAAQRLGRVPEHVDIAYATAGGASRGTLSTVLLGLGQPGVQRRDGRLVPARAADATVPLHAGDPRRAVRNPWRADTVSAAATTGAATVETWTVLPGPVVALARRPRVARAVTGSWPMRQLLRRLPEGPSVAARARGSTTVRATARAGTTSETVVLHGPDAYDVTTSAAVAAVEEVLSGDARSGYSTPALLLGAQRLLALPGVREF